MTLTVRGVDTRVVQLMRIAAIRLRMTQGEATEAALRYWLNHLKWGPSSRFSDLGNELEQLGRQAPAAE